MSKFAKMARFLPSIYSPVTNTNMRGILNSWSVEDDEIVQAIQDAKDQIFVASAGAQYLDALGSNVGVFRPAAVGLADAQYRRLIPLLSYYPKQVLPTMKRILEVFFNDKYEIFESNPNEIVINIPSAVPALRRVLKGSHHLHALKGIITSVDNIFKEIVIDLDDDSKVLLEDELALAYLIVGNKSKFIISNTSGTTGVTLQFNFNADLSDISMGEVFNVYAALNENKVDPYVGGFLPDKTKAFTVTSHRAVLAQNINQGIIYPTIIVEDASNIPDEEGRVIFDFGRGNEEVSVRYFGRPNNTTLLLDPSYTFLKNHSIGGMVNVTIKPYQKPDIDGRDYSAYLVSVEAARILCQQIIQSIAAAGVVIRWIITEPKC